MKVSELVLDPVLLSELEVIRETRKKRYLWKDQKIVIERSFYQSLTNRIEDSLLFFVPKSFKYEIRQQGESYVVLINPVVEVCRWSRYDLSVQGVISLYRRFQDKPDIDFDEVTQLQSLIISEYNSWNEEQLSSIQALQTIDRQINDFFMEDYSFILRLRNEVIGSIIEAAKSGVYYFDESNPPYRRDTEGWDDRVDAFRILEESPTGLSFRCELYRFVEGEMTLKCVKSFNRWNRADLEFFIDEEVGVCIGGLMDI